MFSVRVNSAQPRAFRDSEKLAPVIRAGMAYAEFFLDHAVYDPSLSHLSKPCEDCVASFVHFLLDQ
jgi:hypothetical protein